MRTEELPLADHVIPELWPRGTDAGAIGDWAVGDWRSETELGMYG